MKKTFDIPTFASEQLAACRCDLAAIAARWPTTSISELWFDRERTALATDFSGRTRAALFGNWMVRTGKAGARFARTRNPMPVLDRFRRFSVKIALPRDAVILLLDEEKTGLVLASAEANLVAKLRYGAKGIREWEREIAALFEIEKTEARKHIAPVIDYGMTPTGCAWIVAPLAPNHHPILPNIFRGDRRFLARQWRNFLRSHILPVMENVYNSAEIDEISASDYLQSISSRIDPDDPLSEHLLRKMNRTYSQKIARSPVLISRIHGDLYPRHIHRSGTHWWLLDWGESNRRELFLEILNQHIRRPAAYSQESHRFWNWLNRGGEISGEFGANIVLFVRWIQDWTGHEISPEAIRFQILIHLLKRVKEEQTGKTEPALMQIGTRARRTVRSDLSSSETILTDLNLIPA